MLSTNFFIPLSDFVENDKLIDFIANVDISIVDIGDYNKLGIKKIAVMSIILIMLITAIRRTT